MALLALLATWRSAVRQSICESSVARRSPQAVSRTVLEQELWGGRTPDSDALRSHLYLLRQIVDRPFSRPLLGTVRGVGVRLWAGS